MKYAFLGKKFLILFYQNKIKTYLSYNFKLIFTLKLMESQNLILPLPELLLNLLEIRNDIIPYISRIDKYHHYFVDAYINSLIRRHQKTGFHKYVYFCMKYDLLYAYKKLNPRFTIQNICYACMHSSFNILSHLCTMPNELKSLSTQKFYNNWLLGIIIEKFIINKKDHQINCLLQIIEVYDSDFVLGAILHIIDQYVIYTERYSDEEFYYCTFRSTYGLFKNFINRVPYTRGYLLYYALFSGYVKAYRKIYFDSQLLT